MERKLPESIVNLPPVLAQDLQFLFTDIDGTITTGGILPDSSYRAIWKLAEAGIKVVLVTGRPAGWCDLLARMWPVAGVIGENGSFYYIYHRQNKRMERVHLISDDERIDGCRKLEKIREKVLKAVPRCAVAADQRFRITDLALDYREDIDPPLGKTEIADICRIIEEEGAVYKISDIHINCWYGDFDKLTCARQFLRNTAGRELVSIMDKIIYIGDSPNDEPMFSAIQHSIGVANIRSFLEQLTWPPAYITTLDSAEGFAESVEQILKLRSAF